MTNKMQSARNFLFTTLTCFSLTLSVFAQQELNLGFEKPGVEGLARPWGWDPSTYTTTQIKLDSISPQQGSYSLKMEAPSPSGETIMEFFLEENDLRKKTVLLEGWVRTSDLKGNASFFLAYTQGDGQGKKIESIALNGITGWTKLSVTARLPEEISTVRIGVRHAGTGNAWFDNLTLSVNGKKVRELEVAPVFGAEEMQWLIQHATALNGVDVTRDGQLPVDDDLVAFRAITGESRIIALGESTHGTSEFFRLKHRILDYCVRKLGVRVFAIEDHPLVVARANQYVLGGAGTARAAMGGMLGVWQTKEVHDLISWMRRYNDLHPGDKVQFTGFDIQNHSIAIDSLYNFLEKHSPQHSIPVQTLLTDLRKNGRNSYSVSDSVKLSWFTNAGKVATILNVISAGMLNNARSREDSITAYWGLQYATLILQFAENTWKGHASLYRDIAMADNVSWIINTWQPGSKLFIWAHDVHISRGDHPDSSRNIYYGKSMGAHLSKKYGDAYRSFGLLTYQGTYSCYVSYTNFKVTDCPLYKSPRGSLDEALHRISLRNKTPGLLLDMRTGRKQDWLARNIPVRFANHVNIEYGYWTRHAIPFQFDGVFFIDNTSSAGSYAR